MDTASLKTPGVYIQEIPVFPPSVAEVETAIPAFIGFTELVPPGESVNRISSLNEYVALYGKAENQKDFSITADEAGNLTVVPGSTSKFILFYALQMFYANGGGPAYISSAGSFLDAAATGNAKDSLAKALDMVKLENEPTLLLFPDAVGLLPTAAYYALIQAALAQCALLQDRFTIIDVPNLPASNGDSLKDATDFRTNFGVVEPDSTYGAAYYPNIKTTLSYQVSDDDLKKLTINGAVAVPAVVAGAPAIPPDPAAPVPPPGKKPVVGGVPNPNSQQLNILKQKISDAGMILPPSAAIAGIYARTDNNRGVWKAPANVNIINTIGPVTKITDEAQGLLNIDVTAGKSINAIRAFTGKGTLVWGARTLAGNDNEWRYINVRRLFIQIEESIKKSTYWAVFEPNDANTWVKVRSMIENYLIIKWKDGALAGIKPEDAYYVRCGLNQTMTAQDILEGRLNVEIGLAAVRPAEFIILKFYHKLQVS